MNKKTGARILVETLERLGVETIFGIPGIHNLHVYDELITSSLRHVTARNEAGAGFMADGYGRSSGRPGVALVITGPGLTNILTPMGEAFHDSVPMVVISSQLTRRDLRRGKGELHELKNSTIAASSVSKESRSVFDPEEIEGTLRGAYEKAMSGRPGPVHVEIPYDVLAETVDGSEKESKATALREALSQARRPVLLAGGGARFASSQVSSVAESYSIPVVTTVAGKGVLDERSPLSLGSRVHLPAVVEYLESADLLLLLGTQLSPTDLWQGELKPSGRVATINIDPHDHPSFSDPELTIREDVGTALAVLLSEGSGRGATTDLRELRKLRETADRELPAVLGRGAEEIEGMREVLRAIREALGEEGILFADMTTIAYAAVSEYSAYAPGTFFHPVGYGTLGYAVPAALGALAASADRKVCALAGDGGFQFTMQELGPLCEAERPSAVVIWNDGGYGEIRRTEEERHPGRRIAVDNRNPDFLQLAEAYGIAGHRAKTGRELQEQLNGVFKGTMPAILEVRP
ncbi:MAG: thiamine pyrophosphate-binding protein [Spirochaetaceae bacterium]